jgi:hypothetical protein
LPSSLIDQQIRRRGNGGTFSEQGIYRLLGSWPLVSQIPAKALSATFSSAHLKLAAMSNPHYRVTFDRRVEIIELQWSRRGHAVVEKEPVEDEDYSRCDNDEIIVARRFESVEFHEICRDVEEIRMQLEHRRRTPCSILHHGAVSEKEDSVRYTARRRRHDRPANSLTPGPEPAPSGQEEEEACRSPVLKKARPGRGLRRKSLSLKRTREEGTKSTMARGGGMPRHHTKELAAHILDIGKGLE